MTGCQSRSRAPLTTRLRLLCIGAIVPASVLAAPSPDSTIRFRSAVVVDRPTVMLADVADLTALPEPVGQRAATVPVVSLARSVTAVRVDARRLAESARHEMPMLAPWLANVPTADVDITLRHADGVDGAPQRSCVTLLTALRAETSPSASQIRPARCPGSGRTSRAWRYDADSHVVRAARDLSAGEVVQPPAASRLATVQRGGRVLDTVRVGAVTVTRSGTALADAGPRHAAPVLTGDSAVRFWRTPSDAQGF